MDIKPLFSYRSGKSFIHKMPAVVKVILLFALPATVFFVSPLYCFIWIGINAGAALYAGFGIRQQILDLKPLAYYVFFLILVQAVSFIAGSDTSIRPLIELILKLVCALQITSLFFNTTTSLELKSALEKILPARIALLFVLFLAFIPMLFSVWARLELSWKARAGKNGVKKLFVLLPVFISLSLFKARSLFYSLQNRN
ncbi:CbiQ family ECF transporter T component [Treponema sp. HNW]|uniref:energy-coupling factor transporter transmembrane component T family protein n=1 Tax=Treponema sp. HNW TaxID=3116654 RepID=UPI003D11CC69